MRLVQNGLENSFAEKQAAIEEEAIKFYNESPDKARKFLTDYSCNTADATVARWKELGEFLIVRYNDGAVKRMKDGKIQRPKTGHTAPLTRPGYDKDYLEQMVKLTGDRYKVKEIKQ